MTDIKSNIQEYGIILLHKTYFMFDKKTNLHIWPKRASP